MEELLSHCPRWVLPGRGRPALCAVSGGLDSMCLLDLLVSGAGWPGSGCPLQPPAAGRGSRPG